MKPSLDPNTNNLFWKDSMSLKGNPYILKNDLSGLDFLLVFPTEQGDLSIDYTPLALGFFASLIRMNKGKAEIYVQNLGEYNPNVYSKRDLIAVYPMIAIFNETLKLTEKIKSDNPNSKICLVNSDQHQHEMILCTPRAKEFAENMMRRAPSLDYALIGEAEKSFIELCDTIKRGKSAKDISACFYRENGEVKFSDIPISPVDFNFLPLPSRDHLEDKIIESAEINTSSPRVQSSRGCCSPCLYCAESFLNITRSGRKSPILRKDIISFVDELQMLQDNYKAVFFNIIDSSFEDAGQNGIKRMEKFFDEILKRNLQASFKIHLRAETIPKLDDAYLLKAKEAGTDIIITGIESIIPDEISSYKRKIVYTEKDVSSIQRLDSFDKFWTLIGHMMFSANLSLEDLPKKAEFMKNLNRSWDSILMSSNLLAFRGTAYHDFLRENHLEIEADPLSPLVPYKCKDMRVAQVANEMGNLKLACPQVVALNNQLYDSMNIDARFTNKMNAHLSNNPVFPQFKANLSQIMSRTGEIYNEYFLKLVGLASDGWKDEKAKQALETILHEVPSLAEKARHNNEEVILSFEKSGLSTKKLYLKTWISLIHSKINPAHRNK